MLAQPFSPRKEKYALKSYTLQSGAGPKLPTVSFEKIFVVSVDQVSGLHANHVDGVSYAAVRDDGDNGDIGDAETFDAVYFELRVNYALILSIWMASRAAAFDLGFYWPIRFTALGNDKK